MSDYLTSVDSSGQTRDISLLHFMNWASFTISHVVFTLASFAGMDMSMGSMSSTATAAAASATSTGMSMDMGMGSSSCKISVSLSHVFRSSRSFCYGVSLVPHVAIVPRQGFIPVE